MKALVLALALWPASLAAQAGSANPADIISGITADHIMTGYQTLATGTAALEQVAETQCDPQDTQLRAAFGTAFDAWVGVSHLRFGPSEAEARAFALAYWPDGRGATPKALKALIANADPAVQDPDEFAQVSVAARGFYALEFLLYDPAFLGAQNTVYRCALIQAITKDMTGTTAALLSEWGSYQTVLLAPSPSGPYRSEDEVMQELFKALSTGLEFTADTRLGRPLGTYDRPRPTRAEARRSGRSLRHVELSLLALHDLAMRLSSGDADLQSRFDAKFDRSADLIARLDDPVFAGVSDPAGRLRVESLQQSIKDIRDIASTQLGPLLGVAAGFNALDGD